VRHVWSNRWLLAATVSVAAVVAALLALVYAWDGPKPKPKQSPKPKPDTAPSAQRRWPALAALTAGLAAVLLLGGAFAYDASQGQVIASGVRVGPVDVGGLTAEQAKRKLMRAYRRLDQPLVLRTDERRFELSPHRVALRVDVEAAVERALDRSRGGWFLFRTLRELVGRTVDADVSPRVSFSSGAVDRFAVRLERAIERPPRPAQVVPSAAGLEVTPGQVGLEVDTSRLRRRIERRISSLKAPRVAAVPAHRMVPKVTDADLARRYPAYITVDRANFTLRVYENLKLTRTYPIAVGQVGLETPAGLYHIQNKQVDPSWSVPLSSWAGSLAGSVIPPGPSNPLKARWMGIFDGAGIHGTDQEWSLGSAASHGCIRMAVDDVIDLYDRVDVGTPIYIG
jgi:lipoprotein-anchoring transpeptidase ErfK/SrfK